jgi:hypothetical protein
MNAQIFLSCGQNPEYDEPRFVQLIKNKVISLGFEEPYVAVHRQSSRSIRENVFKQLQESDYFIWIDFKREEYKDRHGNVMSRGSLFTNQELALASFLEMEIMLFQEEGVRRDGMLSAIQGNATSFSDRNELPDMRPGPGFYDLAKWLGKKVGEVDRFWLSEFNRVHDVWANKAGSAKKAKRSS